MTRTHLAAAALLLAGLVGVSFDPARAEATLATSPLVGADALDEHGVASVVEVLPAGSYTYFRLADDPRWFVTMRDAPSVGSRVRWRGFATADHFHSRRLDRQFATLVFASVDAPEAP
jgi:hypothetical protein